MFWLLRTIEKLELSVETDDQVTVFGPLVVQPLLFEGCVTWRAAAEAARARRLARANMVGSVS